MILKQFIAYGKTSSIAFDACISAKDDMLIGTIENCMVVYAVRTGYGQIRVTNDLTGENKCFETFQIWNVLEYMEEVISDVALATNIELGDKVLVRVSATGFRARRV